VLDRPGVLSAIAGALGQRGISIASVVQPERHESRAVPVVIMTHHAPEAALRTALEEIDQQDAVQDETRVIRIEREI
jgi:homoserine dehydrogenase